MTTRQIDITADIAVDAVQLPAPFHKDPADSIIVATARALGCPILTNDESIVNYPYVRVIV
ncbi:MAG TPA: PIN domain-containing protein [Blastocatellia bacterium]|nr:PIN domain-containing protein [Blastocatellia bacterium]